MKKFSIFLTLVILLSIFAIPMTPALAVTDGYYTYTVSSSKATITKCDTTISGAVEIPSELGGYPVTKIDESAFYGCKSITSVVIPNTVLSISNTAFGSCTALEKVVLPNSISSIMLNAFTGCNALKEVHISDLEAWLNISFGGHYSNPAFISKALYLNEMLVTDVIVPYGVAEIGAYAFTGYTPLESITITSSVTKINNYAFYKCTGLKEVALSSNLKSIGGSAFSGCTAISEITIPRSVTTIYNNAFLDCTSLTDVYYTGLESEWANITIGTNNEPLTNATFHHLHTVQGDWIVEKKATCSETGLMYKDCIVCDGREEQIIPKLDHTYSVSVIDATCKEAGYKEYVCSDCGYSYKDDYVSANGHNYYAVITEPTCTSSGYTVYSCDCGESYISDYTSMKGHSFAEETTEPTCTTSGYTAYTCEECGLMYTDDYASATEHDFSDWEVTVATTCSEEGTEIRTCNDCGHEESRTISQTGHSFTENTVEPTCDTIGYTEHICDCGEYYKDNYVSELGHVFTDWFERTPVSCSTEGELVRGCLCGYEEVKYIDKLEHTYELVIIEPTPEAQGYTEHTCSVCGDSYQDSFVDYDALSRIVLSATNAAAGHKFKVTVSLTNNPGIMSAKIGVKYDTSVMTLVSVEDLGNLGTEVHSDNLDNPYILCWVNDTATENYTYNGDIAILEFMVNSDVQIGEYSIEVFYDYDNYDIINCALEKVEFVTENTVVNVKEVNYGDVNSDGEVNNLDRVILTRFLAEWEGYTADTIDLIAADVNRDGSVNTLDRVILTRYLADWEDYATLPYSA